MSSYSFSPSDECSLFADCTFRQDVQLENPPSGIQGHGYQPITAKSTFKAGVAMTSLA